MKDDLLSSAVTVRDPAAAAVFADSRSRRLVMLFAASPLSLTQAAAKADMDLKRLHHHVQKLVRLGLLEVAAIQPRAGRPIKLYRATSPAFFIPDEAMPRPFADQLAQELRRELQAEAARSSRGLLMTLGPGGEPLARVVAAEDESPQAFELWRILRLARGDLNRLRADLDAVLRRYQQPSGAKGSVYLVHAALARRADQSGGADNIAPRVRR